MENKGKNRISKARVENYDKYSWFCDDNFAKWIGNILEQFSIQSLCDIGAGTGFMLEYYSKRYNPVLAIEPNKYMVKRIEDRKLQNIELKKCYAEKIEFADKIVDLAISKSSLHHFYDIPTALGEMERISRRYLAIIEVIAPHKDCIPFLQSILIEKEPNRDKNTVFLADDIIGLLQQRSYKDIKTYRYDQVFDVDTWLTYGDIRKEIQEDIRKKYDTASKRIKYLMGIRYNMNNRLTAKRRMMLAMVELNNGNKN